MRRAFSIVASILSRLRIIPEIGHQPFRVGRPERSNTIDVEIGKGGAEGRPLPQYCRPGQARLIDLQDQPFEQHRLIARGKAVFGVVVDAVHRMAGRKPAIRRAQVTAREN